MKRLLALLALVFPLAAFAQAPIQRNSFTTNAPAKAPKLMTTTTGTLYPLMVTSNNVAADQDIQFSSGFYMSNNIGHFENWILLSGRTNQLSMNSSNLLFNGHAVLTNAPGGSGITNSGVGTNNYLTKWVGTNSLGVSQFSDDGTNVTLYMPQSENGRMLVQPRIGIGDTTDPNNFHAGGNTPALLVASTNQASVISIYTGGQNAGELNLSISGGDIENPTNSDVGSEQNINFWFRRAGSWQSGGFLKSTVVSASGDATLGISAGSSSTFLVVSNTGSVFPNFDNAQDLGLDGNRWLNVWSYGADVDGDIRVSGNISPRDVPYIWPTTQGATNTTTVLANDGTGVLSWEAPAGSSSSNPINNFYSTNNFFISGKGNTLVITQTLTVSGQYVYPLVPGTGITFATNNIGTGQTNLTISASGSSTPTTVTTLAYTGGTNLVGFDGTTNGATFKVTLTNNAFLGGANATNFPNADTYKTYTLHVINDSTGVWTLTFDAAKFAWSEGVQPVKSTNGSGYDVYYFHTHGFTNGMLVGTMNALIR